MDDVVLSGRCGGGGGEHSPWCSPLLNPLTVGL